MASFKKVYVLEFFLGVCLEEASSESFFRRMLDVLEALIGERPPSVYLPVYLEQCEKHFLKYGVNEEMRQQIQHMKHWRTEEVVKEVGKSEEITVVYRCPKRNETPQNIPHVDLLNALLC